MFGAGGTLRDADVAVGTREQGVDLGGLLGDRSEGAAFERTFGAGVLGGGDRLRDGLGHGGCRFLMQIGARTKGLSGCGRCVCCMQKVLYD